MANRARVVLYRSLGALLERLPEAVDVAVARRVAAVAGRRNRARRDLGDNVRHALGATAATEADLVERFVSRAMASYGQYWAESAKLAAMSAETITERFVIADGLAYLEAARDAGLGVVVALPHVGSWEWGGAYLAQIGIPMTAVAEAIEPPALFEWFRRKRQGIGIRIEPLNSQAGTVLLDTLRAGGIVGLVCDRDIANNGVEVTFFDERVTLPAGPATLALRTGATLVAAACYAGPGRDHFAVITPPIEVERRGRLREDVTRITQVIATELEGLISRAPDQWHVLQARFDRP